VARIRSERLSWFLGALQRRDAAAVLRALDPWLASFRSALRVDGRVPGSIAEAGPVARQLQTLLAGWPDREAAATQALPDDAESRSAFATSMILLHEAAVEAQALAAVYADMEHPRSRRRDVPQPRFHIASDWFLAVLGGARAMVVMLITCTFWILSAGPEGFSATLLSAVGCALFASMPNPTRAIRQMGEGFLIGLPLLLVCYSWILPVADGFTMLMLGLSPFLAFGAWLMTRPGRMLQGSGYFLFFLTGLNLTASMRYDFIAMFNNALALLGGMGVAGLSFLVLVPPDRDWRRHRAIRVLLGCLELARDGRERDLRSRFESRVRGFSVQLVALAASPQTAPEDESLGLVVLEVGDAIIRLRDRVGFEALIGAADEAVERRDLPARW
jgi:uncharacterized membrane protein YccC